MLFKQVIALTTLAASAMAIPFSFAGLGEVGNPINDHKTRGLPALDLDLDLDIKIGESMKPTCFGEWVHHHKHHHKVWKPKAYCSISIDLSLHVEESHCFKWGGCCAKKHKDSASLELTFKAECESAGGDFWYV